ncbi:MAG: amino acid permease, partial [Kiritimatiellae bacterium]|nr:amino acid permease [Kiritimatiellia bacterium]
MNDNSPSHAYLSPLAAWALAFGCAVGWGAFVMPGTTFLPIAGPLGTALGILGGALAMGLIALNYHFLIRRHPDAGGAYAYVKDICNRDHGFLCAWFLLLTYSAIVWANATALVLIPRNLFGPVLQFGFHYHIADFEVWLGEILASIAVLLLAGTLLSLSKRWAARLQTLCALVLLGGVALGLVAVLRHHQGGWAGLAPAFSRGGSRPLAQILGVMALAPWAFVGFESVSHSVEGFRFKRRRGLWVILAAIASAAFAYIALVVVAAALPPEGFADWSAYVKALPTLDGVDALPVFNAVETAMGPAGVHILATTTLAAILTGLLGFLVAASRLVVAVARDGLLPRPLAALGPDANPVRAVWALVAVSCLLPFVGRTAIGWIVDVTTVGASVVYGYVSWCAFAAARLDGDRLHETAGLAGLLAAVLFAVYCLVPRFWAVSAFSTESYFILAVWSLLGCAVFLRLLRRDHAGTLGKSTVVWIALLLLISFATHMWVRQATFRVADGVVAEVGAHYAADPSHAPDRDDPWFRHEEEIIDDTLTHYHLVQMALVVVALSVMVGIYTVISRRERDAAKAKEYFFSTVSHDIRTPLNAIIGYSETLRLGPASPAERDEALASILSSSKTLLRLVNDILDLSRLESGKLETSPVPTDVPALLRDVASIFAPAARKAGLDLRLALPPMPRLLVDPVRLRQIAFNLVGNAVKFTEKGHVEIRAAFNPEPGTPAGELVLSVEDTGVGIAREDLSRIANAYVQLGAKLARNGGTGVGLAVCRHLAAAMGGTFTVQSTLGQGSTFTVTLPRLKPT